MTIETRNVYITSVEGETGKSSVALGILDALSHETDRVGVFRPVARSTNERDYVLELLLGHDSVDLAYEDCIGVTYDDVHADGDAALARIVERYKAVEARCDAVVVVGSDFTDVSSPTELSFNARIAANLGTPVVLVLGGRDPAGAEQLGQAPARTPADLAAVAEPALRELAVEHAAVVAVVLNRADPEQLAEGIAAVRAVTDRPSAARSQIASSFTVRPVSRAHAMSPAVISVMPSRCTSSRRTRVWKAMPARIAVAASA